MSWALVHTEPVFLATPWRYASLEHGAHAVEAARADMKTHRHPTHHDNYRAGRLFWAIAIALGGVFACVFLAMADTTAASDLLRQAKRWALWAGGLAFVGGTLYAVVIDVAHRFTRCPSCGRRLLRSRIDYQQSYYPCRRCDVTWTCPCHKSASASAS